MFISKKYKEMGFVSNHPDSNAQKAASLLLKVFVSKTLYQNEIKKLCRIFKKIQQNHQQLLKN
jgi:hypothetical protein